MVGIDINYETVGKDSSMLMVSVSGTALALFLAGCHTGLESRGKATRSIRGIPLTAACRA